jgi:cellulose synthase/poly-beta-1,6-N-acetylglucosamine synthase-like glycosyltransferase
MNAMQVLFWINIGLIFWTYLGYPCFLALIAWFRDRKLLNQPGEPTLSVIIAAYNEQKHIGQKLANTLTMDYPQSKLEVIVASDCSTDGTHAIVDEFRDRGVKLVVLPQRGGKTAAQNAAVLQATGEILVFTDATTILRSDALRELVMGFSDPKVGCIDAPHESVSERGTVVGEGGRAYRRYETVIKDLEARVNSLIGVTGCLYAVRRALYEPLNPDLISDFVIASKVYSKGYISIPSYGVVTREIAHEDVSKEFEMRVRIVIRSIHGLVREARMLNPFRYGFFSFQLLSHKVLRYLMPELLLGALFLSLILSWSNLPWSKLYFTLFVAQLCLYAAAFLGWLTLRLKLRVPLLYIPFYFVVANLAALWGFLRYLRGERKVTWTTIR